MGRVAGGRHRVRERRVETLRDRQPVVRTPIELDFNYRAEPDADAEHWHAPQITFESCSGIKDVASVVDAAFDQHESRSDNFRIFRHQRPLLRAGGRCRQHSDREKQPTPSRSRHFTSMRYWTWETRTLSFVSRWRVETLPSAFRIEFLTLGCSTSSCAIRRFIRCRWRLRSPHAGQQQPTIGSLDSFAYARASDSST